tara:strand:+ start:1641 stop:1865 length:225 start_codon:yes stop_codon:yes gene_type:complete
MYILLFLRNRREEEDTRDLRRVRLLARLADFLARLADFLARLANFMERLFVFLPPFCFGCIDERNTLDGPSEPL